jgi:nitrite reductase/ring-hydroxylating ferredoxin subunit
MKCKRQFGPYIPASRIPWLKKLEAKFATAKMKNFICPHKGLPCNGTPIVDGVVVCRGHGLAFNVETGSLVTQSTKRTKTFLEAVTTTL